MLTSFVYEDSVFKVQKIQNQMAMISINQFARQKSSRSDRQILYLAKYFDQSPLKWEKSLFLVDIEFSLINIKNR
jgi:hypothetical protein